MQYPCSLLCFAKICCSIARFFKDLVMFMMI